MAEMRSTELMDCPHPLKSVLEPYEVMGSHRMMKEIPEKESGLSFLLSFPSVKRGVR